MGVDVWRGRHVVAVALAGSSLNLDVLGNPIPLSGVRGQVLDFSGSFSDPGFDHLPLSSETFSFQIDYGDGTVTPWQTAVVDAVGSPGTATIGSFVGSHLYMDERDYSITVRVKDDDGGITEVTQVVHIAVASLQVGSVLAVGGSTANDDLRFSRCACRSARLGPGQRACAGRTSELQSIGA